MLEAITRSRCLAALRGVLVMAFEVTAITFEIVAITFAIMAITFWMLVITFGVPVLAWVVGIAAVVVTFVWPGQTALTLLYFIALWAIVTNFAQVARAVGLRQVIDNEWTLVTGGFLSVAFGVLATIYPGTGVLSTIWLVGFYTMIFGVLLLLLAFRLRGMATVRIA